MSTPICKLGLFTLSYGPDKPDSNVLGTAVVATGIFASFTVGIWLGCKLKASSVTSTQGASGIQNTHNYDTLTNDSLSGGPSATSTPRATNHAAAAITGIFPVVPLINTRRNSGLSATSSVRTVSSASSAQSIEGEFVFVKDPSYQKPVVPADTSAAAAATTDSKGATPAGGPSVDATTNSKGAAPVRGWVDSFLSVVTLGFG